MAEMIKTLLITSCIGTILAGFLIVLRPVTRKVFSSSWHYYMWLGVLIVMILPVKFSVPILNVREAAPIEPVIIQEYTQNITEETLNVEAESNMYVTEDIASVPYKEANLLTKTGLNYLFYIWLIGFAILLMIKIISYIVFLLKIRLRSQLISCPEIRGYTKRKVVTRVSDSICSPLMVGIFKPILLLPKTSITEGQLSYILEHETTHLKRQDILYKWFLSIVKCIHWFNPAIYVISEYVSLDCEISCDMEVVKNFDMTQTNDYVETILSLLSSGNKKQIPLTTGMTGNKKSLKKRFINIKNNLKISRKAKVISLLLAAVIVVGTIYVSGLINGKINLPDDISADIITDERQGEEFNLLMIGVDETEKADTILVFNYDGKILTGMVIPRNVDLPYTEDSYTRTVSQLLAKENGDQKVIDTMKSLLGIPIHYYARVNIQAVEDIVDSIGGMELNIPYNMQYDDPAQDLHINLTEGEQLLNGEQIGHLLRFRDRQHPNGEEIRVMTWHSVTEEFLNQAIYGNKLTNPAKLYEAIAENVKTNYSLDDLVSDIESFKKLDRNNIVIENIPGRNVAADDGYFVYRINMVEAEPLLEIFNSSRDGAKLVPAVTYTNERLGFKIRLPENWKSRYRIVENDNQVEFYHKEIFLKYGEGSGGLFKIIKLTPPLDETGEDYDYLYWAKDFAFAWFEFTDVQHPILDDRDDEDVRLAEEYKDMLIDLEFIKNSFTLTESQQEAIAEVKTENARKSVKTKAVSNDNSIKIKSSQTSDYPYSGFDKLEFGNINSEQMQDELQKMGVSKANSNSADLSRNYIAGAYSYKDGLDYNNNVVCDANGNISVYFDVNTDNLVDVNFYEAETKEDVGGYKILANNQNAYTFMGFDPEKTYIVDVQGETGSSWKVEGEYIIY